MKFVESAVTFTEFPDEIALCLNISNCPNHCQGCHSAYLAEDIGTELTTEVLDTLIATTKGITLIGFMGGDAEHEQIAEFVEYIHSKGLKVGMYSGRDSLDLVLATTLDYYKIGRWIPFTGDEETWRNQTAGPLCLPTSNQIMFARHGDQLIDITQRFRKNKINKWSTVIIK